MAQRLIISAILMASLTLFNNANAMDDFFDLTIEELMNIKVTSASKREESAFDSAAATYVITGEDIERSGATSIPEALRLSPGVQVARVDADEWAISIRGFNDTYSDKLLVLIDGRSAYVSLFSGVYWNSLTYLMGDIDRIEVIRGSGGAIWGANAVNGVINIITKTAHDTYGGHISVSGGEGIRNITEVRYGAKNKNRDSYRVYARNISYGDTNKRSYTTDSSRDLINNEESILKDGDEAEDESYLRQVGFRFDTKENNLSIQANLKSGKSNNIRDEDYDLYTFNNNGFVQSLISNAINPSNPTRAESRSAIEANIDEGDRDGNSDLFLNIAKQESNILGGDIIVKYNKYFKSDSKLDVQFYIDYDKRDDIFIDRNNRTIDLNIQHDLKYSDKNRIIYGAEYRNIHDNLRPDTENLAGDDYYINFERSELTYEIWSAFFQNKTEIVKDKFFLTIGSKFEYNDFSQANIQPTIRVSYIAKENHHIWSAISRTVRTPTRWEDGISLVYAPLEASPLFREEFERENIFRRGNQNFDDESSIIYEIGYKTHLRENFSFDIASFYNRYDNLRALLLENSEISINNSNEAESFGSEISINYDPFSKLRLSLSYSYAKLNLLENGRDSRDQSDYLEYNLPRNILNLRAYYNLSNKLKFDNIMYYTDQVGQDGSQITSDAYIRYDTRVAYEISNDATISFIGQNLTDPKHKEWRGSLYSAAREIGRTLLFKIDYKF